MIVGDNYGARWMKQILNWVRIKTLNQGCPYSILIRDSLIENGLKKNKTVEMINEYVETGLLKYEDGLLIWVDLDVKAIVNMGNREKTINDKAKPYYDAKKKVLEEDKKKKEDE